MFEGLTFTVSRCWAALPLSPGHFSSLVVVWMMVMFSASAMSLIASSSCRNRSSGPVFAAMMIGFGRAVGETMIVFMAAGNTPLMSWSPLNGFRTLSANIAVEIPEADYNSTLYRVLFLCAVLLFLLKEAREPSGRLHVQ